MKSTINIIAFLFPIILSAQEFLTSTALTSATQGAVQARFENIGGAGYQDILISSYLDSRISWHNGDGEGSFLAENSFESTFTDPVLIAAGQMDQNPLSDIIAANVLGEIYYCSRTGLDSYAPPVLIATTEDDLISMDLQDLNNDGLVDIVVSEDETGLVYYPSNGDGTIGSEVTIANLIGAARSFAFGDFNGDNMTDVVFTHDIFGIGWASQEAGGTFGDPSLISPPDDAGYSYRGVHVPNPTSGSDILVASYATGEVLYFHNLDGAFASGIPLVLDSSVQRVKTSDMDGDGDLDLITADDNEVSVFENLGLGLSYGPAEIVGSFNGFFGSLDVKDVDDDGLGEILLASLDYNGVKYFENDPIHGIQEARPISADAVGIVDIQLADIDGDGDMDLVSGSKDDHKISWYEKIAPGVFGPQRYITDRAIDVTDFLVLDFYGDGHQEIITERKDLYGNPRLAIIDNDGSGQFAYPDDIITFGELYAMDSGHLDSDDKEDIVMATAYNFGTLYRVKLNSANNLFLTTIGTVTSEVKDIQIADMNGDSYNDIVISSVVYGMFWYRNHGNGLTYDGPFYFDDELEGYNNFSLYDLDQDSDQDIVACAIDGGEAGVYWYENSGEGVFTRHNAGLFCSAETEFGVGDVEGDGDVDIIFSGTVTPFPRLALNNGVMQFTSATALCIECPIEENSTNFLTEDSDGDGDLDVYFVSDDIYYTENEGLNCPEDINRDGWININDFLIFNSNYGSSCSGYCPSDVNGDGIVGIEDFIMLNSVYGESCN